MKLFNNGQERAKSEIITTGEGDITGEKGISGCDSLRWRGSFKQERPRPQGRPEDSYECRTGTVQCGGKTRSQKSIYFKPKEQKYFEVGICESKPSRTPSLVYGDPKIWSRDLLRPRLSDSRRWTLFDLTLLGPNVLSDRTTTHWNLISRKTWRQKEG